MMQEMKRSVIELQNVVKSYGDGDATTYALRFADFYIVHGVFLLFIGQF